MRSEPRRRAVQVMAGLVMTVCIHTSGCRNPVTIEATSSSPSGVWVAELISDDVSELTGTKGDRAYLVLVRKPQEQRDTDSQMVLQGVGRTAPSMKWVSEHALDVHVPQSVEVITQRKVAGVTVNVR
jgi:hypothetical protein